MAMSRFIIEEEDEFATYLAMTDAEKDAETARNRVAHQNAVKARDSANEHSQRLLWHRPFRPTEPSRVYFTFEDGCHTWNNPQQILADKFTDEERFLWYRWLILCQDWGNYDDNDDDRMREEIEEMKTAPPAIRVLIPYIWFVKPISEDDDEDDDDEGRKARRDKLLEERDKLLEESYFITERQVTERLTALRGKAVWELENEVLDDDFEDVLDAVCDIQNHLDSETFEEDREEDEWWGDNDSEDEDE
jgi:hypothetical protein